MIRDMEVWQGRKYS